MADYAVKRIDDMEAIYGGAFKRARAELGIESFGIQVIDMPPNADQYPEHDHAEDGQEEVYIALSGGGEIEIDGERFPLDTETMVRVSSGTKRKLWPGDDGPASADRRRRPGSGVRGAGDHASSASPTRSAQATGRASASAGQRRSSASSTLAARSPTRRPVAGVGRVRTRWRPGAPPPSAVQPLAASAARSACSFPTSSRKREYMSLKLPPPVPRRSITW